MSTFLKKQTNMTLTLIVQKLYIPPLCILNKQIKNKPSLF